MFKGHSIEEVLGCRSADVIQEGRRKKSDVVGCPEAMARRPSQGSATGGLLPSAVLG